MMPRVTRQATKKAVVAGAATGLMSPLDIKPKLKPKEDEIKVEENKAQPSKVDVLTPSSSVYRATEDLLPGDTPPVSTGPVPMEGVSFDTDPRGYSMHSENSSSSAPVQKRKKRPKISKSHQLTDEEPPPKKPRGRPSKGKGVVRAVASSSRDPGSSHLNVNPPQRGYHSPARTTLEEALISTKPPFIVPPVPPFSHSLFGPPPEKMEHTRRIEGGLASPNVSTLSEYYPATPEGRAVKGDDREPKISVPIRVGEPRGTVLEAATAMQNDTTQEDTSKTQNSPENMSVCLTDTSPENMSLCSTELSPIQAQQRRIELKAFEGMKDQVRDLTLKGSETGKELLTAKKVNRSLEKKIRKLKEEVAKLTRERNESIEIKKGTIERIRPLAALLQVIHDEIRIDRETDVDYLHWRNALRS